MCVVGLLVILVCTQLFYFLVIPVCSLRSSIYEIVVELGFYHGHKYVGSVILLVIITSYNRKRHPPLDTEKLSDVFKNAYMGNPFSFGQLVCITVCIHILNTIIYYIKLKSRLSVCLSVRTFCAVWLSAVAAWVDVRLARHGSYVFWHDQVYFFKFLRALIFRHKCTIDTCVDPDSH